MAFIFAFLMARRKEKQQAFGLFRKGWTPPDIAEYLLVPLRTVQRWHQDYCKIQKPEKQVKTTEIEKDREKGTKNDPSTFNTIEEKIESFSYSNDNVDNTINKYTDISKININENWEYTARQLAQEHLVTHVFIRRKLVELLTAQIEENDLNIRAIQILSRAICAHTDLERASATMNYLDINRAAETILRRGWLISSPQAEQDKVEQELEQLLVQFNSD